VPKRAGLPRDAATARRPPRCRPPPDCQPLRPARRLCNVTQSLVKRVRAKASLVEIAVRWRRAWRLFPSGGPDVQWRANFGIFAMQTKSGITDLCSAKKRQTCCIRDGFPTSTAYLALRDSGGRHCMRPSSPAQNPEPWSEPRPAHPRSRWLVTARIPMPAVESNFGQALLICPSRYFITVRAWSDARLDIFLTKREPASCCR
jgi:hypothetical protein